MCSRAAADKQLMNTLVEVLFTSSTKGQKQIRNSIFAPANKNHTRIHAQCFKTLD